jgi:hypothetical protein
VFPLVLPYAGTSSPQELHGDAWQCGPAPEVGWASGRGRLRTVSWPVDTLLCSQEVA